jgi:hypothetical protein
MTDDIEIPTLSAEAIREAFIADAAADTELVVRVSELLTTFGELKERIEATHKSLVEAYAAAEDRPNAAKKLVELGLPRPGDLGVDLGTSGRNTNGKRGTGGRRRARSGTVGKQQTDGQPRPEGDAAVVSAAPAQAAGLTEVLDAGVLE